MQLSKLENKVYEELKRNNLLVFKAKDLCLLLKLNKTQAYNILKSLKRKKAIENIKKGLFSFKDVNEFILAVSINNPAYISFWSALSYYKFTENMPKKIFLVSTKYFKEIKNFKYITLSKKRFFGYINLNGIVIAEKEKAIIDSLLFPKYSGGIKEIIKSVNNSLKEIDIQKLFDYASKIESKSVLRRLGYILETLNHKKYLKYSKEIKKRIGKGYELLDPNLKRKNKLNKEWLLDINI